MKDSTIGYSKAYLDTIRLRFPERSKWTNNQLIYMLDLNKTRGNSYEDTFPTELSETEKLTYFNNFDGGDKTISGTEHNAPSIAALPRKQAPKELGNNYIVSIPGNTELPFEYAKNIKRYFDSLTESEQVQINKHVEYTPDRILFKDTHGLTICAFQTEDLCTTLGRNEGVNDLLGNFYSSEYLQKHINRSLLPSVQQIKKIIQYMPAYNADNENKAIEQFLKLIDASGTDINFQDKQYDNTISYWLIDEEYGEAFTSLIQKYPSSPFKFLDHNRNWKSVRLLAG